ncbi:double-strand break repair protein MRE11 isoform X2 [Lepeophtheirus salmonis]|uniref:double-strand break repair protein MRE11 isoform X2 n=1 Tax=Lepeophtheirus salmonis TaxID=72036 RepID=UPI001AEAF36E|nr:double-strand break repair protein MRE11-like isoform X2 [Lepeophtheirus salmonis]
MKIDVHDVMSISFQLIGFILKVDVLQYFSFHPVNSIESQLGSQEVDFVLLGGDLFHDNKPSRWAEKRCFDILRSAVLGDSPIKIEFLSDPATNFGHSPFSRVNFEDPDLNVGLPIFTVHGNHDDPSGLGGYSVLDTLHSSGLVNYFGKYDDLTEISMSPILLRKGDTNLALYGLSSLKDERLHKMFLRNQIRMMRPRNGEWFNMFVIHQNRAKHGPTNYIPEKFIDGCVDLVLWGHEHECRIEPETIINGDKEIFVTQPGSSVATSLCDGESKEKKVAILSVFKDKFKIQPIPLKTVRPMIFKTISIDESKLKLDKRHYGEKDIRMKVEEYLQAYVEEMLIDADSLRTGHPKQPELPLLRLRVEYSDDAHQLTPGRFGNIYHNKVANPSDILLFRKKIERNMMGEKLLTSDFDTNIILREGTSMKDFISQYFNDMASDEKKKLKLLGVRGIATAVENFIEKDHKDSISIIVDKQLKKAYDSIYECIENESLNEDNVDVLLEELAVSRSTKKSDEDSEALKMLEESLQKQHNQLNVSAMSDDEMEENNVLQPVPVSSSKGSSRGRSGRGRGSTSRGRSTSKSTRGKVNNSPIKDAFRRQSVRKTSKSMYVDSDNSD